MNKRTEIINHLIKEYNLKSYLEIGLNDPNLNYNNVVCENKECCDHYMGNTDSIGDELPEYISQILTYRMTSDDMFNNISEDKKYDIIFIDGLHECNQVGKDINNSLKHLNKDGFIVLHDCLPTSKDSQIYPRPEWRYDCEWYGDVWRIIPELSKHGILYNVINTDCGTTVLRFIGKTEDIFDFTPSEMPFEDYFCNVDNIQHIMEYDTFLEEYKHDVKVALCCIVKMENLYLRDFVEYYKKIGVNNIILYDNNDTNGEYPHQVIGDYINNGYVIYHNYRGRKLAQVPAYNNCYETYKRNYDWIMYFDTDEFLTFKSPFTKTVQDYLMQDMFKEKLGIYINWLNYDDNDQIFYENKPIYERFTRPCDPSKTDNHLKKLIIKCDKNLQFIFNEPLDFEYWMYEDKFTTWTFCYNDGTLINSVENHWFYINHNDAYLKHYKYMTITEYLTRRLGRRSYACNDPYDIDMIIGMFTSANNMTSEKENIIKQFLDTLY